MLPSIRRRRWRAFITAVVLMNLPGVAARSQERPQPATLERPAAQSDEQSQTTALDVAGRTHTGRLAALDEQSAALTGETPVRLPTSDLVRLDFAHERTGDTPIAKRDIFVDSLIQFDNNDRLAARTREIDGEQVRAVLPGLPNSPLIDIPLETVRRLVMVRSTSGGNEQPVPAGRQTEADVVLLVNGDRVTGELKGMDGRTLTITGQAGEQQIRRAHVRTILFNPELISFPPSDGKRSLLTFTDGSRLTVRNLQLTPSNTLLLDALFGARLEVPVTMVLSIQFLGGRVVYLSDLEPAEYEFTPFLSAAWPFHRDRNVLGGPLRLRGREYAKGLGMHSRSVIHYDLAAAYRSFQAEAGIDDAAGGMGNVVFAVELDGVRVFTSDPQTGTSPPLRVGPVDVAGKRQLTLIVDFGTLGDVQDRADWCDARLVK